MNVFRCDKINKSTILFSTIDDSDPERLKYKIHHIETTRTDVDVMYVRETEYIDYYEDGDNPLSTQGFYMRPDIALKPVECKYISPEAFDVCVRWSQHP